MNYDVVMCQLDSCENIAAFEKKNRYFSFRMRLCQLALGSYALCVALYGEPCMTA